jgi:hypothetical protein
LRELGDARTERLLIGDAIGASDLEPRDDTCAERMRRTRSPICTVSS